MCDIVCEEAVISAGNAGSWHELCTWRLMKGSLSRGTRSEASAA